MPRLQGFEMINRQVWTQIFSLSFLAILAGLVNQPLRADDKPQSAAEEDAPTEKLPPAPVKTLRQPGDDEAHKFEPKDPTKVSDPHEAQAIAWFLTGEMHKKRQEIGPAVKAFESAIEAQPGFLRAYGSLVPLLFAQNQRPEARKYAIAALEYGKAGLALARNYATLVAGNNDLGEAVEVLNAVLKSKHLKKDSFEYFSTLRDQGLFLRINKQTTAAAEKYRLVFDAVQSENSPLTAEERELIAANPGEFYDELGKTFLDADQPDLALRAFEVASKFRKTGPEINSYNLASVFRKVGKPQEGLDELYKYFGAQLQTRGREAYQLLKDLLADLKKSDELLPKLRELAERDPKNQVLAFFLADQLLDGDQIDEADRIYKATSGENDPRRLTGLAGVALKRKQYGELLTTLEKLYLLQKTLKPGLQVKVNKDFEEVLNRVNQFMTQLSADKTAVDQLLAASVPLREGDEPKLTATQALALIKVAFDANRDEPAFDLLKFHDRLNDESENMGAYQEIGQNLMEGHKYKLATRVYQHAYDSSPTFERRWLWLYYQATSLALNDQTTEALEVVRRCAATPNLPPTVPSLLKSREGWILTQAGQYDAAIEILTEAIKAETGKKRGQQQPEQVQQLRFTLSNAYVQKGDMSNGEKVLEVVLAEDEDSAQGNNDLGYLWADQGKNLEKAKTMIEKALSSDPENGSYIDSLGWVLLKMDRAAEGREQLLKACQKLPEQADMWEHLGDCEQKLGLKEESQKNLEKAWQLESAKPRADEKLRKRLKEKLPESVTSKPTVK